MGDRVPFAVSIILSVISLIIALWKSDGATVGVCAVSVTVSVLTMIYCQTGVSRYSLVASSTMFICTVIMAAAVPYEALMGTDTAGTYASALILGMALIPQAVLILFIVAAMFGMSLNWAVVSILGWPIGVGLLTPKYLAVLLLHYDDVQTELLNSALAIGMLVSLIMLILFFFALGRVLKKRRLFITSNGLEALR